MTKIEWCDETVNPIRARNIVTGAVGHFCEKVSPGCTHCYASDWNTRVRPQASGKLIGTGLAFDARNRDKVEHFLDESLLRCVLRRRKPTRFFWIDMTDWMGEWVRDDWLDQIVATMILTPQHTHLTLTKRDARLLTHFMGLTGSVDRMDDLESAAMDIAHDEIGRTAELMQIMEMASAEWPPKNIRLGISVEDVPRASRFDAVCRLGEQGWNTMVSMEPLLHDVDVPQRYLALGSRAWVIPGGESSRRARACCLSWIRNIVCDCEESGVACFVKQLGAKPYETTDDAPLEDGSWPIGRRLKLAHPKGGDPAEWSPYLRVRQFPEVK